MKKLTVSGFINNTIIGTDKEINKYLIDLKKMQETAIGIDLVKKVNSSRRKQGYAGDVDIDPEQHQYPLSITIEPYTGTDQYF